MSTSFQPWAPYWGKTLREDPTSEYHLLVCHCLDVAAVAKVYLDENPVFLCHLARQLESTPQALSKLLVLLLAIHDIGKFEESFQNLSPSLFEKLRGRKSSCTSYKVRHDASGLVAWRKLLQKDAILSNESIFSPFLNSLGMPWERISFFDTLLHAIFGHHGKPVQPPADDGVTLFRDADAQEAVLAYWRDLLQLLYLPSPAADELLVTQGEEAKIEQMLQKLKTHSWTLAGLYVLCDWIGSDSSHFTFTQSITSLADYWQHSALPTARKALRAKQLIRPGLHPGASFNDLFPHLSNHSPRPLQEAAIEFEVDAPDAPHLFILEDETGSGKTEAALMLASKLDAQGLYIALPTMATSNAMYDRLEVIYRRFFGREHEPSLLLAHGRRNLSERYQRALSQFVTRMQTGAIPWRASYGTVQESGSSAEDDFTAEAVCADFFAQHRHLALFADVGVGTIDQALLSILPAKHQSLRLFALSQKVLIVDEVHAFDTYTNGLLENLIRHHAAQGGSTILLSATLPSVTRRGFVEAYHEGLSATHDAFVPPSPEGDDQGYPQLCALSPSRHVRQAIVTSAPARDTTICFLHKEEEVHTWLKGHVAQGKCVCWIRNTVGDAISAARALLDKGMDPKDIYLFHARMTMHDRARVEQAILDTFGKNADPSGRQGKVVISTQVIEQSLDVDFDEMISDLTTIDLLIQRLGRYRRHARDTHGRLLQNQSDLSLDERGARLFHVLAPPWSDAPEQDWYAEMFAHGAFVYPEHDKLWRTMRCLLDGEEGRTITLPTQSRTLVEEVFDPEGDVPEGLEERYYEALIEQDIERLHATRNGLKLEDGYGLVVDVDGLWMPDTLTPTRLGEPTTTLRLLKSTKAGLEPWAPRSEPHPWAMSEVNLLTKYATSECVDDPAQAKALREVKRHHMADHARYVLCVILSRDEHDLNIWHGKTIKSNNQIQHLRYSERFGLERLTGEEEAS